MAKNTKTSYLSSAMLMLFSSVAVKLIGAVYKIPLTAFIGAVGRGYFAAAYNLYMPLHAVLMGSLPIALSRLVSMALAQNDTSRLASLRKGAFGVFFTAGLIGTAVIAAAAVPYAYTVASSPKSVYTILVLAPSLLFSMLAACLRSYYEGRMNMVPTAVSQLLEALLKLLLGLLLARLSMQYLYRQYLQNGSVLGVIPSSPEDAMSAIYPITSAAAMLGVTLGGLVSFQYVSVYYLRRRERLSGAFSVAEGRRELLAFSFPITVSCAVQSVFQFLDTATVQLALAAVPVSQLRAAYDAGAHAVGVADADMVTYTFGLFSTALDFKNLVPGITMVLGVCAVPAICREYEKGDHVRTASLINAVMKYTALLSVFGGGLIRLTAKDLLTLFYGSSAPDVADGCGGIVSAFAVTLPLYSLASTAVFCVQALGKPARSVMPYVVSGVVRGVLNFVLIQSRLLLFGAVIAGAVGYLLLAVSNTVITCRLSGCRFDGKNILIKPLLIGVLTVLGCVFLQKYLPDTKNMFSNLLIESAFFSLLFCMLCIVFRAVDYQEIIYMIKSKKMA